MGLALDKKWLWDSWYVRDGETYHGFFLQADKALEDPELRHWNVTYGHATSTDLINWNYLGTCFAPADEPAWDDFTTWTGSVIAGDDGQWHLFYTGTSKSSNGKQQKIGHAVSDDLHNWTRVGDGQILDRNDTYEEFVPGQWHDRAFRDPWVMRDPDGDGWLMYFTARKADIPNAMEAGAIGFATSKDLFTWELQDPVYVGGFGELEVPQVFEARGKWYCLFCTAARFWSSEAISIAGPAMTGSHYLIADDPRGPWRIAPGPALDVSVFPKRYAARIVCDGAEMKLLGFNWSEKEGGQFKGEISNPDLVEITEDGLLRLAKSA